MAIFFDILYNQNSSVCSLEYITKKNLIKSSNHLLEESQKIVVMAKKT